MTANPFVLLRRELSRQEGRHLTDQQIAWLLGVQPRYVSKLQSYHASEIRPAFILALTHATEVGIRACEAIDDPTKTEFDRLVSAIPLSLRDIATMLGVSPGALWNMRLKPDTAIRRYHVLAVHYLHRHYAPKPSMAALRKMAMAYKHRRKGTPRL